MEIRDIEKRLLLSLCPSGYHQRQKQKTKNKKHVGNIVFSPLFYQARKCSDLLINLNL